MINRVITLQLKDIGDAESGPIMVPIIPIAYNVTPQGKTGWYSARAPSEKAPPGALNATCHPTIARLYEDAPGRFVVFGEKAVLDQIGQGPPLQDYAGDWAHYRIDGDEPDTDPEAKPGARVAVNRVIELSQKPPADVSESKPLMIGDVKVTAIKRSITTTMGPVNLKELAEKKAVAIPF